MSNQFSELENAWKQGKNNLKEPALNIEETYEKVRQQKKENFLFYYGTIAILSTTLIVISCFFYFVAPVQELLSRIGAGLMLGGLIVRILFEIISIQKAKHIHVLETSLKTVNNSMAFYKFRKNIHSKVAPVIIVLYTVGFYLLTPEFLLYMNPWSVVFFDVFYLFIAVFLFVQIRKGVRKEMDTIHKIVTLKHQLMEEKSDLNS